MGPSPAFGVTRDLQPTGPRGLARGTLGLYLEEGSRAAISHIVPGASFSIQIDQTDCPFVSQDVRRNTLGFGAWGLVPQTIHRLPVKFVTSRFPNYGWPRNRSISSIGLSRAADRTSLGEVKLEPSSQGNDLFPSLSPPFGRYLLFLQKYLDITRLRRNL